MPKAKAVSEPYKLIRVASLKTADEFRRHLQSIGAHIPCDDVIEQGPASPMAGSVAPIAINGRTPGNRVAIQPMEGWDATQTGAVTAEVIRRWERFGENNDNTFLQPFMEGAFMTKHKGAINILFQHK